MLLWKKIHLHIVEVWEPGETCSGKPGAGARQSRTDVDILGGIVIPGMGSIPMNLKTWFCHFTQKSPDFQVQAHIMSPECHFIGLHYQFYAIGYTICFTLSLTRMQTYPKQDTAFLGSKHVRHKVANEEEPFPQRASESFEGCFLQARAKLADLGLLHRCPTRCPCLQNSVVLFSLDSTGSEHPILAPVRLVLFT